MQELFREDAYLRQTDATVTKTADGIVQLDRTVFYPNGGGQPGDVGVLRWQGGEARVTDTRKGDDSRGGGIDHLMAEDAPLPPVGTKVVAEIDWQRRHRHMRMHTAMHLVCGLVEGDVTGGQVGTDRSRLDFNIPAGAVDKVALTDALNKLIEADHPVAARWISDADLATQPELVRTMSVKPPTGSGRVRLMQIGAGDGPVDLQPCGGTHVRSTGEIGPVAVTKIENKGRQNRRINLTLVEG